MKISEVKTIGVATYTLSKELRNLRKDFKLTQKQVADLIGTHQNVISDYEMGVRRMSLATMEKLARALDIQITPPMFQYDRV